MPPQLRTPVCECAACIAARDAASGGFARPAGGTKSLVRSRWSIRSRTASSTRGLASSSGSGPPTTQSSDTGPAGSSAGVVLPAAISREQSAAMCLIASGEAGPGRRGNASRHPVPNDFGFWELVDELVQQEPPEAADPELLGLLAAVGVVHGKPVAPDERMHRILEQAVVVGDATARTLTFAARPGGGLALLPRLGVAERTLRRRLPVPGPAPAITPDGPVAAPSDGARKLNAATNFLHHAPVQDRPVGRGRAAVGSRGRAAVGSSVDTIDGRHRDDVDDVGVSKVDFENGAVVAPLDRECVVGVRYFAMGYTVDDVLNERPTLVLGHGHSVGSRLTLMPR